MGINRSIYHLRFGIAWILILAAIMAWTGISSQLDKGACLGTRARRFR